MAVLSRSGSEDVMKSCLGLSDREKMQCKIYYSALTWYTTEPESRQLTEQPRRKPLDRPWAGMMSEHTRVSSKNSSDYTSCGDGCSTRRRLGCRTSSWGLCTSPDTTRLSAGQCSEDKAIWDSKDVAQRHETDPDSVPVTPWNPGTDSTT